MNLKLMYITNNTEIARLAEKNDVDWIFVDLEINGKEERQGHLDTVISRHEIEDVKKIKNVLSSSELLVRVNPLNDKSQIEINRVINDGANIVMLPFFTTKEEVQTFINYVNGRAKTMLLLETPEAVWNIDDILEIEGIDYIHIGLNDLHLGYELTFMFELLIDGTVDKLSEKFNRKGINWGFGGIAQLGQGELPAEYIIAEHFRLGSSMAILSRSFCDINKISSIEMAEQSFCTGVKELRNFEKKLSDKGNSFFVENKKIMSRKIFEIKERKVRVDEKATANRSK